MEREDFSHALPAIWLVFADSYLTHQNAPRHQPDQREKSLLDLLGSYLDCELENSSAKQQYGDTTLTQIASVRKLLRLWSQDLALIYEAREGGNCDVRVRRIAQQFLRRIQTFDDCTVIPNGLILAGHTSSHENVCCAILKKQVHMVDWIQVDPGGYCHQRCQSLAGDKSNAYLEITGIDPVNITEDWLYLLVGLKAIRPDHGFYYKEESLYECLLSHLNGKTVFISQPDEGFVDYSHISPAHTWQVVDQSFRYLLGHFVGETYYVVYKKLITGFKIFLMEKTFAAYCNESNNQIDQCHFLLQEMCHCIAQQALDQGNVEQKQYSLKLIKDVKAAIEQRCSEQELKACRSSKINEAHVYSLSFVSPRLNSYNPSSYSCAVPDLKAEPALVKSSIQGDIIDYLQQLKTNFVDKFGNSKNIYETALLVYGIESFFIEYLAETGILEKNCRFPCSPFSRDDVYLAKTLKSLAEIYYGCQSRLVKHFFSNLTYQPQFYAKNVTFQFFVYAAIAALNLRNEEIGPLLAAYNLSISTSSSLTLNRIIPHLVIDDARLLKVLLSVLNFFTPVEGAKTLFSHGFTITIENDANVTNTDVAFAYQLLQRDKTSYRRFIRDYQHLEEEKFNRKWQALLYSTQYLPAIYCLLCEVAYFAKASLTGFLSSTNNDRVSICWVSECYTYWYTRKIFLINETVYVEVWKKKFKINSSVVSSTQPDSNYFTSFLLKSRYQYNEDPYQRLIVRKEKISKTDSHYLENEIIASQDKKPETMDRVRYMHLGFIQSEAQMKVERLYIALKEQQIDFTCEQECVLIKQTLFEISELMKSGEKFCSLLEWTAHRNPALIHRLGMLCIEKALAMQYRLTQHQAIGSILEVILGLLTYYPSSYKDEFTKGIMSIYHMLKDILNQPPTHLSDNTLLHLNAYLVVSALVKSPWMESDTLAILKALLSVQMYKVRGIQLDNCCLFYMHVSSLTRYQIIEHHLEMNSALLNDLMSTVISNWDTASSWQKSQNGLLFTCCDYAIKPLIGGVYFKNQPILGLPNSISNHIIFKEYLGKSNFLVIPTSRKFDSLDVPGYLSVDRTPQIRLTLVQSDLLLEEMVEGDYQRYISAKELSGDNKYPQLLYEFPHNKGKLIHWLDNEQKILIKDQQRRIIYEWDLKSSTVFSLQHQGYVVPWQQIKASYFKTWLELVELSDWVELIAEPSSNNSGIHIQSLHFPRLGLHFDYRQGTFFSKQIHGYIIAELQFLNTLHGFSSYLVLEKKEKNSGHQRIKVVIPHRKVTPQGPFYVKTTTAHRGSLKSPTYFVYDYDPKVGLLKAPHIRARLYLTLIYYCSASLDDHDVSHCNAYHLARENLEVCWKDQPYTEIELNIIEQMLSSSASRDFHCYRVALYLKVVSLLKSSLRLAFLYTDEEAELNKKRSNDLINQCTQLHRLVSLYIRKKITIFSRIRLSLEEEEDIIHSSYFRAYYELCIKYPPQPQMELTNDAKQNYKDHYGRFFAKQALNDTPFLNNLEGNLSFFNFSYDLKGLNFSSGINGILIDRFRLVHFITLYNIAKASSVTITKYRYLLHHLVFRAKAIYYIFPCNLVMTLGRALLLVAEKPYMFPESPGWFRVGISVDLSKRVITKLDMISTFPKFHWNPSKVYNSDEEEVRAIERAKEDDKRENQQIWDCFSRYDLDSKGIPSRLPKNTNSFTLLYERYINFRSLEKRSIVRQLYLQAAYNDAMYQFFVSVLQKCNQLKYHSAMGWRIVPFISNRTIVTITADREHFSQTPECVSLEKWGIPELSLIDFDQYFINNPAPVQTRDYLFDSELREPDNGYQRKFYSELEESWFAYLNETNHSYSWCHSQSASNLEVVLQSKFDEFSKKANNIWRDIAVQLENRSNSHLNNYFALRWYSGQVTHFNKGDILKLLVEPSKTVCYNPDCLTKQDSIIQDILHYVYCEINASKINRVLAFIDQYKQADSKPEQFSVLQGLVKSLQENIDPASYRYPHWLLFQLENEIIVRENQRELIDAMLNQSEKAMYQLNMGEGKSSVILPLLSYNLANGQILLRINVLSALLNTMKDFLCQCFSGLIRKRIYTLPFHRDTDISTAHLSLIFETLKACQRYQRILLVTPEDRMCLQLKIREMMIENQQQKGATNMFDWQNYRKRVQLKTDIYEDLSKNETKQLMESQDKRLRTCLLNEKYIDSNNHILKVPPRGQGRKEFARFREIIKDPTYREWSCLKAAYRELLYNSTLGHVDSRDKIALLNKIEALAAIDLLDESDEILRHGTELNYTLGDKFVLAGGNIRWQIPQYLIKSVFCDPELIEIIIGGKANGFTAINLHYSPRGGVPFIQLLNESYYENHIKPFLVKKFFLDNLPTFMKYQVNADDPLVKGETSSLRHYVSGQLSLSTEKKVMAFLSDKGVLKDKLLIAKGWLSHGILFHVFNAKYRVQYGLNLHIQNRIPKQIAIPFLGKDVPSPRSEFSHPDVMLGFTIISYLYEGLDQKQLKKTLLKLKVKFSHQGADSQLMAWAEASRAWVESKTDSFPPLLLTSFQHIDLSDDQCLKQLHLYLSGNYLAIFFYLDQFVFIEEAMQYRCKISANAHTLVGYNAALGFSGTDDRKLTMPHEIKSLRSATQEGTNGKLLSVLTQERNNRYHTLATEDTTNLLKELCDYVSQHPSCYALVDAGALVTGLTNYEVAFFLLSHFPHGYSGILYFSEEGNSLTVLTRDGKTTALQDCFLDKRCLFAYLDDVHTRGTDIQLPLDCHAILTIGIGMQKDKLMQAAMRLRKLAQKQSVSLWGTTAVTLAIARENSIDVAAIDSFEVLKWVTRNTIDHINKDLFPVAVRKINFQFLKKAEAWLKEAPTRLDTLIQCCQDKELFSLEDFYALSPQLENLSDRLYWLVGGQIRTFWQDLEQELRRKELTCSPLNELVSNQSDKNNFREKLYFICSEISVYLKAGYVHDSLDNDEEKEVEVEIIEEQQVVMIKTEIRNANYEKAWDARLILQDFITLAEQQSIIMPLNAIRKFVQEPPRLHHIVWHLDIFMTANYINSVKFSLNESIDNYLRPVDVVLIHRFKNESRAVLLSGQEASKIKSKCFEELENNLLVHIDDIDGPSQLPSGSSLSKKEQMLLTIIKLFSGECHYASSVEVLRVAKLLGRLHPHSFISQDAAIDRDLSSKLFGILIEEGYLNYFGIMTEKLLVVLSQVKSGEPTPFPITDEKETCDFLLKKLYGIYNKLIIKPSGSLKDDPYTLRQWVGTRGRSKEYSGSDLESIIESENFLLNHL